MLPTPLDLILASPQRERRQGHRSTTATDDDAQLGYVGHGITTIVTSNATPFMKTMGKEIKKS
jgi:hypothetical protein